MSRPTLLARATFPPPLRLLPLLLLLLVAVGTGCSDDDGDRDAFCATAERFAVDNPAAALAHAGAGDPAATASLLRDAAGRLDEWAEEAPADIRGDVEALVAAASGLAELYEQPATTAVTDQQVTVDTDAVEAASGRVVAYVSAECGVDLEP